ncbi:MAG: aromatic ring-hydroxylating dioxygenase subunit alpha [Rhodospirillaceae bacterium]|nr:aromatic ring-hydroxylating dioxygenase subunit alpha [Rhodospirillaceae bacterium]
MRHETEVALIRRVLDHLAAGTTDMAPSGHTRPVMYYTDAAQFERERTLLFRHRPLAVAFAAALAKPGDFVTHDLSGVPLLLLRGRDGTLRAFVNACRHRGTRVEWETCGAGKRALVCPYHAWTYGDDGALLHIPHDEGFPDLDRAQHGLVALPAAEHAGLVWTVPGATGMPQPDIGAALAPLAQELDAIGLGGHVPYAPRRYELACNWKLINDASLDSYHVRHGHRRTIAAMFLDTMCIFDRFGANQRLYLAKRSIETLRDAAPATWRARDHGNPLYFFFPGTVVLVEPDHAQVMSLWPVSPDRTIVTGATLLPEPPRSAKARAYWDKNVHIFWTAIAEDFAFMESKHSTLRAGANAVLTFGRFEHSAAWFHDSVDAALEGRDGG